MHLDKLPDDIIIYTGKKYLSSYEIESLTKTSNSFKNVFPPFLIKIKKIEKNIEKIYKNYKINN